MNKKDWITTNKSLPLDTTNLRATEIKEIIDNLKQVIYYKQAMVDELTQNEEKLKIKLAKIEKYIKSNDWGVDYKHSSCRMRIIEILEED